MKPKPAKPAKPAARPKGSRRLTYSAPELRAILSPPKRPTRSKPR